MELPRVIEIGKPLSEGWERMLRFCFQPFDIAKWFAVGFCVFLADLGDGGITPNFNLPGTARGGPNPFKGAVDWITNNYALAGLALVAVLAVLLVVFVLLEIVGARGRFMLLHNLVQNKGEVSKPWNEYATLAGGYWVFRVKVLGMMILLGLGISLICTALAWADLNAWRWGVGSISAILTATVTLIPLGLVAAIFKVVTADLVLTHMFRNGSSAGEAWRAARQEIIAGNVGNLFLFYLVRIALSIPAGLVIMIGTLCTCCIAGLPYISSVVFLPVAVFFRCFTLCYVRQFGPQWDVFVHNALECPACGYDLRGNPAATSCPECGAPLTPSPAPTNPWGPAT